MFSQAPLDYCKCKSKSRGCIAMFRRYDPGRPVKAAMRDRSGSCHRSGRFRYAALWLGDEEVQTQMRTETGDGARRVVGLDQLARRRRRHGN